MFGRGGAVTAEVDAVRAHLGELALLANRVERDERRILAAALARLEVAEDEEELRVLETVVERARAVLEGDGGSGQPAFRN